METTIVAGLVGDGERDGGCVGLDFDFLQLRGVAGIGDVGEKRKCHIFAILRQRYGTAVDWEKTGFFIIFLLNRRGF